MLTVEEVRALGECLNTTWGKSSTNPSSIKVTHHLEGDRLDLQTQSIVHFDGERSLNPQVVREREISNDIFKDVLKKVKDDFKDSVGKALTLKEISRDDTVDLIQATSNSPRKIAYYRCLLRLQVS
jgi:uncharacterized Zn finger protein